MRRLLSGNEAIAYGAKRAGVRVATGYPGTPSTEILETLARFGDVKAEWSPNEKVALEVAIGASLGGARSLVAMKHVGLNVAADPLFTLSYTGVGAGLVVVTADDPGMHSSQNEQDNRHYAASAKIPMFEPSDSAEAAYLIGLAFDISERFDTPVLFRTTTRISHSKSLVEVDDVVKEVSVSYEKDARKNVMIPAHAMKRHEAVERRMLALAAFAEEFDGNVVEHGRRGLGVITSGVAYQYAKEVFPDASFLKLGMTHPIAADKARRFAAGHDRTVVVEELDRFLETGLKAVGVEVEGSIGGSVGELTPGRLRRIFRFASEGSGDVDPDTGEDSGHLDPDTGEGPPQELPARPPLLCPGCPHRGVFYALRRLKAVVMGDIGCYTLAVLPPLEAMDTCLCMGAGIGQAIGFERATGRRDAVAVIGDSTFIHSGITSLVELVYNGGSTTVIVLDNRTTAMTGRQDHPGTGIRLSGEDTLALDFEGLARSLGVPFVEVIDPYDLAMTRKILGAAVEAEGPAVVISRRPCVLLEKSARRALAVTEDCNGCLACVRLGCPGVVREDGGVKILADLCTGCGLCEQVCRFNAINAINPSGPGRRLDG